MSGWYTQQQQDLLERGRDSDRSCCGQHFPRTRLVLVYVVERGDEFAEQCGDDAGDVNERTLFP